MINQTFTEIARAQTRPYWEGSFQHPFLVQLQNGTLPLEKFRYYLIQDSYYLHHFSILYNKVAEQTKNAELQQQMIENAASLAKGELAIRAEFFEKLAITEEEVRETPIAPTTYHYVSHMYRQLVESNDWVAAASLLPCSWLYFEIGKALQDSKIQSPMPVYQKWINTYGESEAQKVIDKECTLLNRLYNKSTPEQQEKMVSAFVISTKMEFNFWEMAYQLETWPSGIENEIEVFNG